MIRAFITRLLGLPPAPTQPLWIQELQAEGYAVRADGQTIWRWRRLNETSCVYTTERGAWVGADFHNERRQVKGKV